MFRLIPVLALGLCFMPFAAFAHEFWIDAPKYQVDSGDILEASLRNGQNFEGINLAYFDRRIVLFDQISQQGRTPVVARPGDSPAYAQTMQEPGLFTLVYQSTPDRLTYQTWEKFQKFVDHKAFGDIRTKHLARGLPDEKFGETYTRYAKALFAVGDGAGQDAARGLEIEIVALKNPYTDDLSGGLPVKVIYREMPRVGAQVEVFEKPAEGPVNVTLATTDKNGVAVIEVKPGHSYLLDNVILREPAPELAAEKNAVWESLWAALTFAVPE